MPNNVLTKSKVFNDFLVATETIKFAITRYGMSYDAGSTLGKWAGYKEKKAKQQGQPLPSVAAGQLDDYNAAIRYVVQIKDQLKASSDKEGAKIIEIELNQQLRRRSLPKMSSEFYRLYNGKPYYVPSRKHRGYFITIHKSGNGYEDENNPYVAYYKIEGTTMKYYNLDK